VTQRGVSDPARGQLHLQALRNVHGQLSTWQRLCETHCSPHLSSASSPHVRDAAAHLIVKVHVVGHHVDVGVEDVGLTDNLFEDVTDASGEDEQGDVVLMQLIK